MFVCSISYLLFVLWNLNSHSCPHVDTCHSPTNDCGGTNKGNSCGIFFPTDFPNVWSDRVWLTISSIKWIRHRSYTVSSYLSLFAVGIAQGLQNIIRTLLSEVKKRFKESHHKNCSPQLDGFVLFPLILGMCVICVMLLLVEYSCGTIKSETHRKFWKVGLFN